ncbi:MAG: OmpA family protein, partial [Pyrinomonadaceae bacterium]
MNKRSSTLHAAFFGFVLALTFAAPALPARAQSDLRRETIAINYPLDEGVTVKFRGTSRLPRLTGEAKVRRSGRRGTRVELSVKNLPRATELGGVYTTYVLWAITPEGRADNLGEIKRSGSFLVNSKLDATTPLQNFALIVTAEPHFLVRGPSRLVVLENLPPREPGEAQVETVSVQYLGNTSDYFNDRSVPEVADAEFLKTPVSLLGARQAVNLARYAGAESDAKNELKEAVDQLESAENAWRMKQPEEEVDREARKATSLGAKAEEDAASRRAARQRRDEIARRDAAVREAEDSAANASQEVRELRSALEREQRDHDLVKRDLGTSNQQVRELRSELQRVREELQAVRADSEAAKVKLARMEGERQAEDARRAAEQRAEQQRAAAASLKTSLARYGSVRDTNRGFVLSLPDSFWGGARAAEPSAQSAAMIEPLAALLANYPDYQIVIEAYTDSRGEDLQLRQLSQARAEALSTRLLAAGVDGARVRANGMGPDN